MQLAVALNLLTRLVYYTKWHGASVRYNASKSELCVPLLCAVSYRSVSVYCDHNTFVIVIGHCGDAEHWAANGDDDD